jgi:hypothetical protein
MRKMPVESMWNVAEFARKFANFCEGEGRASILGRAKDHRFRDDGRAVFLGSVFRELQFFSGCCRNVTFPNACRKRSTIRSEEIAPLAGAMRKSADRAGGLPRMPRRDRGHFAATLSARLGT